MKPAGYVVTWDYQDGVCCVMGWDPDCEGSLCAAHPGDAAAVFTDLASARKAVRVSTAFAKLRKEQGKPANGDFLGKCLRNVRIVPLVGAKGGQP